MLVFSRRRPASPENTGPSGTDDLTGRWALTPALFPFAFFALSCFRDERHPRNPGIHRGVRSHRGTAGHARRSYIWHGLCSMRV